MKKIYLIAFLLVAFMGISQAPQYINYQAVARDASGNIVTSAIGIKFQIYLGSVGGTLVYDETHTATPSSAGIFTVNIGAGTAGTGNFSTIAWGSGPYFLQVNIDPNGGSSYSTVGATKLVSVPYALFAEKAGNVTNYAAGNGIAITSGSIINTAPNQTVNISGTGVSGTYPNYSISTAGTTYSAGNGISITSGSITNTAPDQTVNISQSGIANVNSSYPNFTVNVPPPALAYNNGTKELTLTQGSVTSTATLTGTGSSTVAMYGTGIATVTPTGAGSSFTVNVQPINLNGSGSTNVSGAYPNYTISSTSFSYTGGTGISVAGNVITNTAPNQTVSITGLGSTTVSGSYPNYTIASPNPTIAPPPVILGAGITTVITAGNNYTVNTPPLNMNFSPATGILSYNQGSTSNTVNLNPNMSFVNPVLTIGANTLNIPGTGLWTRTGTVTSLSNPNDWVGIGTNAPSTKLQTFGSNPSNVLNAFSGSPESSLRLHNDDLTNNNFSSLIFSTKASNASLFESAKIVGQTTDHTTGSIAGDLVFLTRDPSNILERMRITSTGNVGIGTPSPAQKLDISGGLTYFRPNSGDLNKLLIQDYIGSSMRLYTDALIGTPYDFILGTYPNGHTNQLVLKQSNGYVGIGTTNPLSRLHVNGQVTISDGTEGDGKILVSNTAGNSSWKKGSTYSYFYPSATGMSNVTSTAVMVTGMSYSINKLESGTTLEINFIGHMSANGVPANNGVVLEIRLDGNQGTSFSGRAVYWQTDSPNYTNIVAKGIFENIPAGAHNVQIWVYTSSGTTTSVFVNPGNWTDQIIVKETH